MNLRPFRSMPVGKYSWTGLVTFFYHNNAAFSKNALNVFLIWKNRIVGIKI